MSARIGEVFGWVRLLWDGGDLDRGVCLVGASSARRDLHRKNEQLMLLAAGDIGRCGSEGLFSYGVGYLMAYVGESSGGRHSARVVSAAHAHADRISRLQHVGSFGVADRERCWVDGECGVGVVKDMFQNALTFLAMVGVILYQDWKLAGISLVVIPLAGLTMVRVGKRLKKLAASGQAQMGDMSSTLQETFAGIRVVKAFGREDAEAGRFQARNQAFLATTLKTNQVWSIGHSHMEVIGVISISVIIWYGGYLVINGTMTPGAFFSFMAAMLLAYTPVRKLSGANNLIQQALAAAERVFDVLDMKTEQTQTQGMVPLAGIHRAIEFQGVSLRYESQKVSALTKVDLTIRPGEVIALVGSSGSGKTTLVSLLPRFYEPTTGRILIDGVPLDSYELQSLRAHIGIVSQEIVLFDDTIRNNIAFGRTGASQAEVEQAAKLAYAHDFILRIPDGYDALIGERGLKLSGGERQRLAIARALLRDPPLLILDEATSALDTKSERIVQLALANLMKNRTTLVIAHRLSTIQNADRIVVLDRGTVVEIGSHEDLLRQGGSYHRLHALQFQSEELAH